MCVILDTVQILPVMHVVADHPHTFANLLHYITFTFHFYLAFIPIHVCVGVALRSQWGLHRWCLWGLPQFQCCFGQTVQMIKWGLLWVVWLQIPHTWLWLVCVWLHIDCRPDQAYNCFFSASWSCMWVATFFLFCFEFVKSLPNLCVWPSDVEKTNTEHVASLQYRCVLCKWNE